MSKLFSNFGKSFFEVDAFLIHLVEIDEGWDASSLKSLPVFDGSDLDTDRSVDDKDGAFDDAGDADDLTHEVIVAWEVDEVELIVLVFEWGDRALKGLLSLLLFWEIVGDGVLLFDFAFLRDAFSDIKERLDERGLAASLVAKEGDITDILNFVCHGFSP